MMRNSLTIISLVLFGSLSFHARSEAAPELFSWSGKVPVTPSMVITKKNQKPSTKELASFEVIYSRNLSLTYSVTSPYGVTSTSEHMVEHMIGSTALMEVALLPYYKVTILTNHGTRVISLRPTSKHRVYHGTPTIITISSII